MVILIDMDGIVADFVSVILDDYNRDYDDNLTKEEIVNDCMHNLRCGRRIYNYFHAEGTFLKPKLIDGCKAAITKFIADGHDVYFVTKPVDKSYYCLKEKQEWVDKNFPEIGHKKVIFTAVKYMVKGDILIDDLEKNLEHFQGTRIMLNQPWNLDVANESINKFDSWDEIYTFIQTV